MKSYLPLCAILLTLSASAQNIGIGTNTPNASAQLDVSSTTKGMLAPRMNTAQRNGIAGPVKGLLVYDTDLNSLYHYNGSGWSAVGSGGGGFSLPFEGAVNLGIPGFKVTNAGAGPAIQAITTNEFGYALQASNTTNYGYSVYAYSRSPNGIGVYAFVDSSIAVKGESGKGIAVDAISTDSTALRARIIKGANADPVILATHAGVGTGVEASSNTGVAVRGTSSNTTGSVIGINNNAGSGIGVYGSANGSTGTGVRGESQNGTGVLGYSNNMTGVSAGTLGGTALYASAVSGTALKGSSSSGYGLDVSGKAKISGGNTNPTAGAVLTSLDASGNAVWMQPATATPKVGFRAYGVSSTSTAGTPNNSIPSETYKKIEFQTESYDTHGDFIVTGSTPATSVKSVFTAPFRGVYHFDAAASSTFNLIVNHLSHKIRLRLNRGGSVSTIAEIAISPETQSATSMQISMDVFLEADDLVWVEFYQSNVTFTATNLETSGQLAFFSGHLIYTQ